MKVLLIGGGGREHALGWKLSHSPRVSELISLPGNPGLAHLGAVIEGIDPTNAGAVAQVARRLAVDLCVVGPEAPLAAGVADVVATAGIPVWGPTRMAAQLESSKTFAKEVMDRAGVDTAAWGSFTEEAPALDFLHERPGPFVVKADGLAAGKGVLVTENRQKAEQWVVRCLEGSFGRAAVLIEDYLDGPEISVFALCAGTSAVALEPARDYKRLLDGDKGTNTGGMGSFSPVDDLPPDLVEHTLDRVIHPVLKTMVADGIPYTGFLYAGLVLTSQGPQVLEFNCRLGDPETQVVLPRLESDLIDVIEAGLRGTLSSAKLTWSEEAVVNVVVAAAGYPESSRSGDPIKIGKLPAQATVFHAGTALEDGQLVSSGGRVLNVVGQGATLEQARTIAYSAIGSISLPGMQYRRDIALPPVPA
ncbi:MAG TPA: phosphoribosylamine--glycine ligase [Acidimicrobiia bacterium]|nr:phosphoribosylamine--glycine ligase [Acidimicrobiia bacterium]